MGKDSEVPFMTADLVTVLQLMLFVAASLVALGALGWRQLQRRRTARYFRAKLKNPDPLVRLEAAVMWSKYGLHRSSPDLLALSKSEYDPVVIDALAKAVRVRAWEPDSRSAITPLRAWAARYHQAQSRSTDSVDSSTETITPPAGHDNSYEAPSMPLGTAGDGQVSLNWAAPDNDALTITDYVVQFSKNGGPWAAMSHSASPATSSTVTGLMNGEAYRFRVWAVSSAGISDPSPTSATIRPIGPEGPTAAPNFPITTYPPGRDRKIRVTGVDLSGCNLAGTYLSGADLSGADLSGADLSGADLSGADLSGADLFETLLSGANLTGTKLAGAYLSGAYLSGDDATTNPSMATPSNLEEGEPLGS